MVKLSVVDQSQDLVLLLISVRSMQEETLISGYSVAELRKLDTKILVQKFFDPESQLFVSIEFVMHEMAVTSIKTHL